MCACVYIGMHLGYIRKHTCAYAYMPRHTNSPVSMPPNEHLGTCALSTHTATHSKSHLYWHTHADPVAELRTRVRVGEAMDLGAVSLQGAHMTSPPSRKSTSTFAYSGMPVSQGVLLATLRDNQSYPRNPHSWGVCTEHLSLLPSCLSYLR